MIQGIVVNYGVWESVGEPRTLNPKLLNPKPHHAGKADRGDQACALGGSCVAIRGVICRVTMIIARITGLVTPLISIREPPSV